MRNCFYGIAAFFIILFCLFECSCSGQRRQWEASDEEVSLNERGRQEIVFCSGAYGVGLRNTISEYNNRSDTYEIVVMEPEKGESIYDFRNRVQLELSDGDGPDLMDIYALQNLDMRPYAESGVLEDVTDYVATYQDLNGAALGCDTVKDRIYGVPVAFKLFGMVTTDDFVVDGREWDYGKCIQLIEQSNVKYLAGGPYGWTADKAGLYNLSLFGVDKGRVPEILDLESRKANFLSGEFEKLLEFSKKYADDIAIDKPDIVELAASGELAFLPGCIVQSFSSFWENSVLFQGEARYVGYPGAEGGAYEISTASYYINSHSKHKGGAYDFLSFLLSDEWQEGLVPGDQEGFPARENILRRAWKKAEKEIVSGSGKVTYKGLSWEPRLMTKEEERVFWEMLEHPEPYRWQNMIEDIIWDEALPYFSGEKSAREVAEIIQNRVQLYLNE